MTIDLKQLRKVAEGGMTEPLDLGRMLTGRERRIANPGASMSSRIHAVEVARLIRMLKRVMEALQAQLGEECLYCNHIRIASRRADVPGDQVLCRHDIAKAALAYQGEPQ